MKNFKLTSIFLFLIIVSTFSVKSQNNSDYVYISGTRFTYPLLEKWIGEFKKENPGVKIKLQYSKVLNDSVNLRIVAHTLIQDEINPKDNYIKVGRYAILPIINERNHALKKEAKRGLKQDEIKKVFFVNADNIIEDDPKKSITYTVYSHANQGCSTIAFANHFGFTPNDIKGKKISGDDKYLTMAVQKDTTGVTYNNLGYIFDLDNRSLVRGINILPIDLNENGKTEKDKQIFQNLDVLISYLENNQNKQAIPVDVVSFIVDKNQKNGLLNEFINWVLTEGQQYNHLYGFLNTNNPVGKEISQNTH